MPWTCSYCSVLRRSHSPRYDLARAGGEQATTQTYQRGRSRAFRRTFALVIVGLIVVDHSEEGDDILLFSALDVFIERSRNRLLLRTVMSQFPGFLNKPVVDGKVSWHITVSGLTLHNPMLITISSWCVN
jgi:hypothetical protein